jgi:transcription-repair coupling factor (superfamily II helicase)
MCVADEQAGGSNGPAGIAPSGWVASVLVEDAATRDLVFAARDEQRAAAIAAVAQALAPGLAVIHMPSSDALPGDDAPASPANVGRRVAALRRLRLLAADPAAAHILLVTTAEATAVRYPAPDAFEAAPPAITTGEAIDLDATATLAAELGYIVDDRVDEPGEIAIRGSVIDLFPADSDGPVRVDVVDGRVAAIRCYDAATQMSGDTIEQIDIGRAIEPDVEGGVSILAHVPAAAFAQDGEAPERRARLMAIAGRDDADAWDTDAATRDHLALPLGEEAPPRFVEARDPARAFARFAKARLAQGRVVIAGSPRDLRFLGPRVARASKVEFAAAQSWAEVLAAPVGSAMTIAAPIDRGFARGDVAVIAAADLLGGRAGGDTGGSATGALFGEVAELRLGDLVVHEDFGIGAVAGLEPIAETGGDAIALTYAREGRRLVPVAEADRLWRYGGDADAVTLDALDGSSWRKRRGAIDAAIAQSARALAEIAAQRDARTVEPVVPDAAAYERFAGSFAFTETADQARAIAAVRADLASGKPMDRLIVGDVGYGKTEVALRAAAMVALAGRQVAIAAPTTVLVRQHIETFAKRFAGTGIDVAGLSRLSSTADKKRVKAGLADGSIRVVIGTGAVAAKGVAYADLALVIVDEEQRFGAADKAKLQGLGAGHALTLSATPIPRTLQSALIGLQQISVIATAPARRQPIRTTVAAFDDTAVRAALLRERGRGGQSFVVVPRIDDMAPLAATLARLVPELAIVQAHGRMPAAELDEAMVGFARGPRGGGDVLLATNIIEAGLDVPRANTMIVHHADRFGLSQLHQLRGRVGRGGRRGQVLLTTAQGATISERTVKRLRTLQAFDRLGAGFAISARDLDLRGAGDLVGEAQAGHMTLIGIDLYQHLLTQALRAARGEAVDSWTPELHVELAGRLPEDWIPEVEVRLALYGRLSRLGEAAAVDGFEHELEDRFGALPDAARHLLDLARLRVLARAAGIRRVDAGAAAIALTPRHKAAAPDGLIAKGDRWVAREAIADPVARVERVRDLLAGLHATQETPA